MPQSATRKRPVSLRRAIAFRLAAIAIALAPFCLLEAGLWLFGVGQPRYQFDPFVGFRGVHPLFVLSPDGSRYETARSRLGFFRPESFAARKPKDEFRIFCLGGSTVQGEPFAAESAFPMFLELGLAAADPSRRWETINCGGLSYASYRLVPILEEVLRYEPDLVVLYTGQNEFLEDRTYGHLKRMPEALARPIALLAETRTCHVLRQLATGPERGDPSRPILGEEVEALLGLRGGFAKYRRDEKWRRDVIAHYQYNLRRMIGLCRQARVPLVLANPVCNLRDCPPFKSQHREGLTAEELVRWDALVAAADSRGTGGARSIELLGEALRIDDQHAGLHYLLAKHYDAAGDLAHARREYLAAKENDICPLRILEPMNQAVLEIAGETGTPLVDVRRMYERMSEGEIPGNLYLVDHVHPSIEGHQLVANLIVSELSLIGIVKPEPEWRQLCHEAYQRQIDSLGDLYYSKGMQRLEMLRYWTQGRASGSASAESPAAPAFRTASGLRAAGPPAGSNARRPAILSPARRAS